MNEMIGRQLAAMELKTPYSPVIHNPEMLGNLIKLDGHLGITKLMRQMESALIILLDMKQGVN